MSGVAFIYLETDLLVSIIIAWVSIELFSHEICKGFWYDQEMIIDFVCWHTMGIVGAACIM